jgi:tRNA U34 2-thiouridine synthase MnmA/TrmU
VDELLCDRFTPAVADLPQAGPPEVGGPWMVRIRHRHAGARVAAWRRHGDTLHVSLAEPVFGAAPGQGLTLYDGDRVLGGGRLLGAENQPKGT